MCCQVPFHLFKELVLRINIKVYVQHPKVLYCHVKSVSYEWQIYVTSIFGVPPVHYVSFYLGFHRAIFLM